jgi:hypothetical protein
MAQSMPVLQKTFKAAGDLSLLQFTFVKLSADYTVAACGDGEAPIGILQNNPAVAGLGAVVRLLGTSKLKVDGNASAISAGSLLKSGADGAGHVTTTNKHKVAAMALEGSTADGDIIEVMMLPLTYIVA